MFKIKLYGTNATMTLDGDGYADAIDFGAVTNINIEINCYFVRPHWASEGEELTFAGNIKDATGANRLVFDIETAFLVQSGYSFVDRVITAISALRYKFIQITEYDLDPTLFDDTKCIPCYITSKEYGEEGSLKNHILTVMAKYGGGAA